jgi:hypothetical protein
MPNGQQFLRDQALLGAVCGSLQRSHAYVLGPTDAQRRQLGTVLRHELLGLTAAYVNPVDHAAHLLNIQTLSDHVTIACREFLAAEHLRTGVAQKALNLYLKYLWCLRHIPEPPHCPFDRRVIAHLRPPHNHTNWTQLDGLEAYANLVEAARVVAGDESLAMWELRIYQDDAI